MDTFTHTDLRKLLDCGTGPCVSLYLPTHRISVQGMREDVLRLHNMIDDAKERLTATVGSTEARNITAPAQRLLDDEDFWRHQSDGLAVFMAPDMFLTYRLPVTFTEAVGVSERFFVTPLVEHLSGAQRYYILAISQGATRLLEASNQTAAEVEVPGLPKTLDEALWYKETEKLLSWRGKSAGQVGNYHGEGADTREPRTDLHDYLLKVNDAVGEYFKSRREPLVVCAVQPALGMFNAMNKYPHRAGDVEHNPDRMSDQELHDLTWSVVEPKTREPIEAARNRYGTLAGSDASRTETDPTPLLEAASQGRVDTLLVSSPVVHEEVMAFHESVPSEHGSETPSLDPEVEAAVRDTYNNSGHVVFVPQDEMPDGAKMAAIMRY